MATKKAKLILTRRRAGNHGEGYLAGRASLRPLIEEATLLLERLGGLPRMQLLDEIDDLYLRLRDVRGDLWREGRR